MGEYRYVKSSISPRTRSNTAALEISRHSQMSEEPRRTNAFDIEVVLKTGKNMDENYYIVEISTNRKLCWIKAYSIDSPE